MDLSIDNNMNNEGMFQVLVDQTVDGIIVTDSDRKIIFCNPAAEKLFGRSGEQFIGLDFGFAIIPGESTEITIFRKQHGHRVVELRAAEIDWKGDRAQLINLRDITDRKHMEREIQDREREKSYLLDNIGDAIITIDEDRIITSANRAALKVFGYEEADLLGMDASRLLVGTDGSCMSNWLDSTTADPGSPDPGYTREFNGKRIDGSDIVIEISASWIDVNNQTGYILAARDITAKLESEKKLRIISSAIEQSLLAKLIVRADGVIEYCNEKFLMLTGLSREVVSGNSMYRIFALMGEETEAVQKKVEQAKASGGYFNTLSYTRDDNIQYWVDQYVSPIRNENDSITHYLISLDDISAKVELAKQLEHQSTYDELTNLYNRNGIQRYLDDLIRDKPDELVDYCLYYVDLDRFNLVSSAVSVDAANQLLCDVADRLSGPGTGASTVARLGADIFLLLVHCPEPGHANSTAERLLDTVRQLKFTSDNNYFDPTATIIYISLEQWNAVRNLDVLIQRCIVACKFVKDNGGDQAYQVNEGDEKLEHFQNDSQGVSLVHRALQQDMFCLYHQPILSIHGDNEKHHYEVLIRIRDGDQVLSPASFMGAAEKYRLGNNIDRWVVNHILSWLANNPAHLQELGHCGINISGESLANASLIDYFSEKLHEYRIPAEKICVEVTETAAVKNLEFANNNLGKLRNLGCRIALDDFGTGMSSFNYLKKLDIDYLKIDGAFIRNIINDPIDFSMVNAIKDVGKSMKIKTIAEFVENDEILAILKLIGIDYAQGYGIGKPVFLC